jgi:hypothetical protein
MARRGIDHEVLPEHARDPGIYNPFIALTEFSWTNDIRLGESPQSITDAAVRG